VSGRRAPLSNQVILSMSAPPAWPIKCGCCKRHAQVGLESCRAVVQSARRVSRGVTEHLCKAS